MHGKYKILLAEDSPADAALFKAVARNKGCCCEFQHAVDGRAALEYLDDFADTIDFIVTDLNMPRMTGKELIANIKKNDRLRKIPIAVLTTSLSDFDKNECISLGAAQFITKSFDIDGYERLIEDLLPCQKVAISS
ncbi:response regulator [Magnetospirillum sp. LM-5]|uniref:response regulator n=1 Tax=Magnetospirillum sp. LM-5 TaxID=2681466 RepID=UPI00156F0FC0|nr:response regulator [Magnetospirillum sp. LM-5]